MMRLSKYYVVALLYHFPSKAKELKLIEALKENISREHSEKALVMELAVMAAFGVNSGIELCWVNL